jgi:hypothetical protein
MFEGTSLVCTVKAEIITIHTKGEQYQLLSSNSASPFVQYACCSNASRLSRKLGLSNKLLGRLPWLHALAAEFFANGSDARSFPQVRMLQHGV